MRSLSYILIRYVWHTYDHINILTYHPSELIRQAGEESGLGCDARSLLLTLVPHCRPCRWAPACQEIFMKYILPFSHSYNMEIQLLHAEPYLAKVGPSRC